MVLVVQVVVAVATSFLLGCDAVDLDEAPGGASSCEPTEAQLTDFESTAFVTLSSEEVGTFNGRNGCAYCHSTEQRIGPTGYIINITATSDADRQSNYCTASAFCDRLWFHATESSHGGGVYTTSDLQTLQTWVEGLNCSD